MTRVLVVDDEPQLLRALSINLRARKYDVHIAATGEAALKSAAAHPPDLVILDLGLPDMDGTEVVAGLRGWTTVPILVLSGRTDSADRATAAITTPARWAASSGPHCASASTRAGQCQR